MIFHDSDIDTIFSATVVTSGATGVSDPIDISDRSYFGAWYTAASTGTPHVRFWYEESYDNTVTNFATPTGISDVESDLAVTTIKLTSLAPIPMRYIRFKVTALTASDPNVTFTLKLFRQS